MLASLWRHGVSEKGVTTHAKGRLVASHTASEDGHRPVTGRIAVAMDKSLRSLFSDHALQYTIPSSAKIPVTSIGKWKHLNCTVVSSLPKRTPVVTLTHHAEHSSASFKQ